MKGFLTDFRAAAIIAFFLVLPFMILELVNRRGFHEGFPIPLFEVMWLLPAVFALLVMPIVRNGRAGQGIVAHPVALLLRVAFLVLIAVVWTGALIDQLPCFLGVPNCD